MNHEIDVDFTEFGSSREHNSLDINISHSQKFHSIIEKNHNILKNSKRNSLPEDNRNNDLSHISETIEFKTIWLLNHLAKMSLNMNRCYVILEKTNLEENLQMEVVLNNFLNQYFSNQDFGEPIIDDIYASKNRKKSFRTKLISKLFNNHKVEKEIKLEKVLIGKENYENPQFDQKPMVNEEIKLHKDVNKKECFICYEMKNIADFIKIDGIAHDFCSSCLVSHVTQKIFSNQIIDIKCPDNCGVSYTDEEIHRILTNNVDLYNKYKKFKKIAILSQDPNICWCVRVECTGYMKGDNLSQKLICNLCGQEMCFLCRNAWHGGQNCEEAMNSEFNKYVLRVEVKECPKCKSKIEKNLGCNHMICSRCHHEFCWICLGQYSRHHDAIYNLFGCTNMQFSQSKFPFICNFFCRILKFLLIILLYLIAGALIPIFLLLVAVSWPYFELFDKYRPSSDQKCAVIVYTICFALCVIILSPLVIMFAIIPGLCIIAPCVINFIKYGPDE